MSIIGSASVWFVGNPSLALIPTMTGSTTPSGTASADSEYSATYAAWKTMDNSSTTYWGNALSALPHWVEYDFPSGTKTVTRYELTASPSSGGTLNNNPKTWNLQGWNGSTWVTVDTQTFTWSSLGQLQSFNVSSPGAYSKYRLYITATAIASGSTSAYAELGQIQLYGY